MWEDGKNMKEQKKKKSTIPYQRKQKYWQIQEFTAIILGTFVTDKFYAVYRKKADHQLVKKDKIFERALPSFAPCVQIRLALFARDVILLALNNGYESPLPAFVMQLRLDVWNYKLN